MPEVRVVLKKIQTSGDKIVDVPLAKIGGKGLFVKEIEDALLAGEIDFAVHSMKDVPAQLPDGLEILCVPPREDARDALISREGYSFQDLPFGANIGTASLRRQAQLLQARHDLKIAMLRGNLDTRLRKLKEGQFDAIVLAAAGLHRLGWSQTITEYLPPPPQSACDRTGSSWHRRSEQRCIRTFRLIPTQSSGNPYDCGSRAGFFAPARGGLSGAHRSSRNPVR